MKQRLESFLQKINEFNALSLSSQVDFLAYFLLIEEKNDGFVPKEIKECFEILHLKPYTNIPSYLRQNLNGKNKKFLLRNNLKYYLERSFKIELDKSIGIVLPIKVYSEFFQIELLDNTRGYIKTIGNQALACYNNAIFDGCSVLVRKLIEILVIECFEKYQVENIIKKSDGTFFYLSDLITEFLKEPKWNIGRNAKKGLPNIKKIGDHSAHNRRYIARKQDLDNIKDDLRIVIEELVLLIDYPNWK